MTDTRDSRVYAGLLTASNAVVAKSAYRRPAWLVAVPGLRLPSTLELPSLMSAPREQPEPFEHRHARLTAASLLYALDKRATSTVASLLRDEHERGILSRLEDVRRPASARAKSGARRGYRRARQSQSPCYYCSLYHGALHAHARSRCAHFPVLRVNHSAHVDAWFDPDTNISEASIQDFQVLLPRAIAEQMLRLSHPLRWASAAKQLFSRSDPLPRQNPRRSLGLPPRTDPEQGIREWEEDGGHASRSGRSGSEPKYMVESVHWSWNGSLTANVHNIIRIDNFQPLEQAGDELSLSFDYRLEECLRSRFLVEWQESGMDIDEGRYEASAVPLSAADDVLLPKLRRLSLRDLAHLAAELELRQRACDDCDALRALHEGNWMSTMQQAGFGFRHRAEPDVVERSTRALELLRKHAEAFNDGVRADYVLVTVSASKKERFTAPYSGPSEMWQLLTWVAPALLHAFLNRGVCQLPELLVEEHCKGLAQ